MPTLWRHIRADFTVAAQDNGSWSQTEVPRPPVVLPADPENPTPQSPQTVVIGAAVEHYGDNGVGKFRSVLDTQETFVYYKIRIRPMGELKQTLYLTQTLQTTFTSDPLRFAIESEIAVSDSNDHEVITPVPSDGVVDHLITFNLESSRTFSETLNIEESLAFYMSSNQWVNPGTAVPSSANTILLSWDSESLELRNPILGDTDSFEATRVERTTRGNELIVYRDSMWPTTEILHFEFEWLSSSQAADLLEFMRLTLGHEILLTDQFGRDWNGYIITPDAKVIQPKRTGYSASFDFQGILV